MGESRAVRIEFRDATERDLPSIYRIFLASVDQLTTRAYDEKQRVAWQSGISLTSFRFALQEGPFLVATEGQEIVGFGAVAVRRSEVSYLYLDSQASGRGIGAELLDQLENRAVEVGLTSLQLIGSLNARHFYERQGYRARAELLRERGGVILACFEMDKALATDGIKPPSAKLHSVAETLPAVSSTELAAELLGPDRPQLLDVREPSETNVSHLEGAVFIPLGELSDRVGELDKTANWVVICRVGGRSARATAWLLSQGFSRVRNLDGGMQGWAAEVDPELPVA